MGLGVVVARVDVVVSPKPLRQANLGSTFFFLKGSFVLQISRRETSPSVKVKLVNHIQLGVWRMKNDANIYWFYGFVGMCIFCHDVSFCDGILKKSKANANHRCAPSSPTLTPRLKTNWPLRVQPYGGPYLYRLYLFSMYNLFAIDTIRLAILFVLWGIRLLQHSHFY